MRKTLKVLDGRLTPNRRLLALLPLATVADLQAVYKFLNARIRARQRADKEQTP